jgi:calcium-dependent protein kinase
VATDKVAGTPFYIAPEIIEWKPYGSKADMWSIGVLLYVLLSGYMPFQADSVDEVFNKIRAGKFNFDQKEFQYVSNEAKDLITKLIEVDQFKRYSAD